MRLEVTMPIYEVGETQAIVEIAECLDRNIRWDSPRDVEGINLAVVLREVDLFIFVQFPRDEYDSSSIFRV